MGGGIVLIALISDVHSNLPALEAVLAAVDEAGVEAILHAGDVVGYNPQPNEVIQVLRLRSIDSIRGNHDRAVVSGDTSWFNPHAARAVEWTRGVLTQESMEYLRSLPAEMTPQRLGLGMKVVHGSPLDEDEYIYPQHATPKLLEEAGSDVLVMGHTHVPYVLETPKGLILNAGSVGQPRDGDPRASWVLLDTLKLRAEVRRITYDVIAVYQSILDKGLPQFLAERLLVGR